MKLLLLADNVVGEEVLSFLTREYSHDLGLVVALKESAVYQMARNFGVPVKVFESSEVLFGEIEAEKKSFDLGVLAWWPTIIKPPLINCPVHGFVNFHPSLLPHNRGKHYNFWALVEEVPFGVTLHYVDEGVDSGDIIFQKEIAYDWTDTGETLYFKAQREIVRLFCDAYPRLRLLDIPRQRQNLSKGSFHRAVELEQASRIDLEREYSARQLLNLLRARTFSGHPACWFEDNDEKYEVRIDIKRIDK